MAEAIPGFKAFELDLMRAVLDQLIPALDSLESAPLIAANTDGLPDAQGVYELIHGDTVKYVGKTDAGAGLRARLSRHVAKFQQRKNMSPELVRFKAVQVLVLAAMDLETELINHYQRPEWNGSGFGANDPGRERETTKKPPEGFDAMYPVDIDLPGDYLPMGIQSVADALAPLKTALPYVFRYATVGHWTRPHPDCISSRMAPLAAPHTVRQILARMVASLPPGWQATYFVSHVVLYKDEGTVYHHGTRIDPEHSIEHEPIAAEPAPPSFDTSKPKRRRSKPPPTLDDIG